MSIGTAIRTDDHTFADFVEFVRDDQKADLLDGVIYLSSPDNTDANDLFVWLVAIIKGLVDARDLGVVYGSRVAFRITDRRRCPWRPRCWQETYSE